MAAANYRKPEWTFYAGWVVMSTLSIPIAWFICWAIISWIKQVLGATIQVEGQTRITEDLLFGFVYLPVLGLLSGLLQYLLLRRYLPRMVWWIAATAAGWLLLLVALGLFYRALSPAFDARAAWYLPLVVVLIGGCVALPQWLLLRRRVRHAVSWILASVLGWVVAILVAGETISSPEDVLAVALLPPAAACIAWWLCLDKLPRREGGGGSAPRKALEPSAMLGAD